MPVAHADFTFAEPVNIQSDFPFVDPVTEFVTCFSADGLEMYFTASGDRPGGYGQADTCVCKRASVEDDWGPPENLGPLVNTESWDGFAFLSADGLALYFQSDRPGGYGGQDLYVARRATRTSPWEAATNLGPKVNSAQDEYTPAVSPDGLELYLQSSRDGGYGGNDLYVCTRATPDDPWGDAVNLGPAVNGPTWDAWITLSPDGLLMFFLSDRSGGFGSWGDAYMARRASRSASWQPAVNLGPVVNRTVFNCPFVSADGSALYLFGDPNDEGKNWTYKSPILPIVDFNGDGQVDGKDLLRMVVQLGGNDSLCDIGPYAWGDGVVDAKDLTVLAEYIGKEFEDPTLVAHWAFDETEGAVAADSAADCDGSVTGGATWQPDGGMVGGALKCDGVTGCVVTGTIPNLGTGPFSVITWVKGGAPGQIILSHGGTTDWLMANPIDGSLMTKLAGVGQPLAIGTSEVVITDGKWHRIALVFDGADRILYMDGKEVARDPQPDLSVADGKFIIGAGSKVGTGWSGLIDDVRIYSRVVRP
jgi:hypothetical protein